MGFIMDKKDLKDRTKKFAIRIIKHVESLSKGQTEYIIGKQLLRCGTSVGANYRASCRARSLADFIAKMGIVEEELDESLYWMEILIETNHIKAEKLSSLMNEANELLSIVVTSIKTAKKNKTKK